VSARALSCYLNWENAIGYVSLYQLVTPDFMRFVDTPWTRCPSKPARERGFELHTVDHSNTTPTFTTMFRSASLSDTNSAARQSPTSRSGLTLTKRG
jgi:hypothetical protein